MSEREHFYGSADNKKSSSILNQLENIEKSRFKQNSFKVPKGSIYSELWQEKADPVSKFDEDKNGNSNGVQDSFVINRKVSVKRYQEKINDKDFKKPWNIYLKSQLESCK
jgi:hypothetical protein